MPVIILPAIDLMDGRAVRLRQGKKSERTEYFDDPAIPADSFARAGARFIHVVDLDGAFEGQSKNLPTVERIVRAVEGRAAVELGGGIRSLEHVRRVLDLGVSRVILGTAVLTDPGLAASAVARFGAERVVVGLDARDGLVAVRGWEEVSALKALDVARSLSGSGIKR
ncbi:1-(5-phosphoribosyl)-5-((5-phosphoribosylamino)methylideneamino)imidazole-4-carboxamide isomerase, partial [bacterium]|nr:1-(5-phosphoribosyl)-5-((5-phosphoribosylamino)methylideneamino)imidazole-4-carboxamide isomerase [bacterium]